MSAGLSLGDDLAGRDPVSIDTELAEVLATQQRAYLRLSSARDRVHQAAGDQRAFRRVRAPWVRSNEECREAVETAASAPGAEESVKHRADRILGDIDEHAAAAEEASGRAEELEAEHDRRDWSRFFHVPGGHIHSSRTCSTCGPTTQFAFARHLSGSTEAEAVADLGPTMCTVCFPSGDVDAGACR